MATQESEAAKAAATNGEVKLPRPADPRTFQDKRERLALLLSRSGVGHWRF